METTCGFLRLCAAIAAILLTATGRAAVPVVSNLIAVQRAGTKLVDIGYNVTADTSTVTITLQVSSDGGTTFSVPVSTVSGHVGPGIAVGNGKLLTWNAGVDWDGQYSAQTRFRVSADDGVGSGIPPLGSMVLIPAGAFDMGDNFNEGGAGETPVHRVQVSAYYLQNTEVTKAQWDEVAAWAGNHGYDIFPGNGYGKGPNHPVIWVSWYEMVKWCNARSEKEGLSPCFHLGQPGMIYRQGIYEPNCNWSASGYRLPTEAEWERAARGGTDGLRFPWGNHINHTNANYFGFNLPYESPQYQGYLDFNGNQSLPDYPGTVVVGLLPPNAYGLYDMVGNLWEWCWDWHSTNYYAGSPGTDPRGPTEGSYRVHRGGSWAQDARYGRNADRGYYPHASTGEFAVIGFRPARSSIQ